jgi:hypothetical protein
MKGTLFSKVLLPYSSRIATAQLCQQLLGLCSERRFVFRFTSDLSASPIP